MNLTIPMYHYVRPIQESRFPKLKGLEVTSFQEQLLYFSKYYTFITIEKCIEALAGHSILPENSILLTFDDGFSDHFEYVLPILEDMGIQGAFFPPARPILENKVLDVHKIHFILAKAENEAILMKDFFSLVDENRDEFSLPAVKEMVGALVLDSRFDSKNVIFFKRSLQRDFPEKLRVRILDRLFSDYLQVEEKIFAKELYLTMDQLKKMKSRGMHIGSHGFEHVWLNSLDGDEQEKELSLSLEFLGALDADRGLKVSLSPERWTIAYPYGAYNETTLELLRSKGCVLGFSTQVGVNDVEKKGASLSFRNPLILSRLDTNDFPVSRDAPPNTWTQKLIVGRN